MLKRNKIMTQEDKDAAFEMVCWLLKNKKI
jgi:hypothetical protein